MPDLLPWLEELLTCRHVSTDSSLAHTLRAAITSALSRGRAAAVEECAKRAREMFLRTWAYAITIDEPSAEQADDAEHKLAELIRSALPLEAAATPSPDALRPAISSPCCRCGQPIRFGQMFRYEESAPYRPHHSHGCPPAAAPEPLTPAAVREPGRMPLEARVDALERALDSTIMPASRVREIAKALDEDVHTRIGANWAWTQECLRKLTLRVDALESRDVRAEIERSDLPEWFLKAMRSCCRQAFDHGEPRQITATVSQWRELEAALKLESPAQEAQRNGE